MLYYYYHSLLCDYRYVKTKVAEGPANSALEGGGTWRRQQETIYLVYTDI
jgi:hypothetical protein